MRVSAVLVVGFWGVLLALLTALLAGMGGQMVVVVIYGSAVAVMALLTVAVAISQHRAHRRARAWRYAPGGGTTFLLAAGALLAGFGLAFGWWCTIISATVFALACLNEVYSLRKRRG
jgi:hypothetical protein